MLGMLRAVLECDERVCLPTYTLPYLAIASCLEPRRDGPHALDGALRSTGRGSFSTAMPSL